MGSLKAAIVHILMYLYGYGCGLLLIGASSTSLSLWLFTASSAEVDTKVPLDKEPAHPKKRESVFVWELLV